MRILPVFFQSPWACFIPFYATQLAASNRTAKKYFDKKEVEEEDPKEKKDKKEKKEKTKETKKDKKNKK